MDISQLSRQLKKAAATAPAVAAAVVSKGALNVKNEARDNAKDSSGVQARHYPYLFGYDLDATPFQATATIGPEATGQGNLGHLLEHGSPTSPGHRDLGRAADSEEQRFGPALVKAFDGLLP